MEAITGTSLGVTIGMTVILMGFCAFMTGQAIANTWRPLSQVYPYALLLGATDRFMIYALFEGELLSLSGYIFDTAILFAVLIAAFRVTRVNKMLSQYPWLYERVGPFGFRAREGADV
ncbi:DUF6867 family protein [Thalassospira alkalitolerans]|uniref:Membrane protein n=1 Tax=Thalassospira alkalitolerans TaxID=1293890 RepID=A0A1Y2LCN3_9PROT|nr:hypothetical protein [Thalassospira alkalitolerans]OSQ48654.1 membrane protein [Thalassospira alkalitolerans]|tara:strand:+ start:111745 stop:112098 length:354 start_codon:yes stop_codon:yes gene_type:complete